MVPTRPLPPLLMVQGNIRESLDPVGTRLALFLLLNKEHSKGGSGLEGLTKSLDPIGCRTEILSTQNLGY